jgi:hypothetical protein
MNTMLPCIQYFKPTEEFVDILVDSTAFLDISENHLDQGSENILSVAGVDNGQGFIFMVISYMV